MVVNVLFFCLFVLTSLSDYVWILVSTEKYPFHSSKSYHTDCMQYNFRCTKLDTLQIKKRHQRKEQHSEFPLVGKDVINILNSYEQLHISVTLTVLWTALHLHTSFHILSVQEQLRLELWFKKKNQFSFCQSILRKTIYFVFCIYYVS